MMVKEIIIMQKRSFRSLRQYIYHDGLVVHGPGSDKDKNSIKGIRKETFPHGCTSIKGEESKNSSYLS
ncbi:hypothetical protein ACRPKW_07760 [Pediococcus pentosaceus]|uniref:hypothetical protein n=1 Tax=Pediococcus pentosaceus TaxID=1255 RepID=UPI003D781B4C